jgi:membrane-bound ClpP family serine protease
MSYVPNQYNDMMPMSYFVSFCILVVLASWGVFLTAYLWFKNYKIVIMRRFQEK